MSGEPRIRRRWVLAAAACVGSAIVVLLAIPHPVTWPIHLAGLIAATPGGGRVVRCGA